MKKLLSYLFVVAISACGQSKGESHSSLNDSPVRYDITCWAPQSFYWVGINYGSNSAYLQLDWGRERDTAFLNQMYGYRYNFEGFGEFRPGYMQRHFQVAFTPARSQGRKRKTVSDFLKTGSSDNGYPTPLTTVTDNRSGL